MHRVASETLSLLMDPRVGRALPQSVGQRLGPVASDDSVRDRFGDRGSVRRCS